MIERDPQLSISIPGDRQVVLLLPTEAAPATVAATGVSSTSDGGTTKPDLTVLLGSNSGQSDTNPRPEAMRGNVEAPRGAAEAPRERANPPRGAVDLPRAAPQTGRGGVEAPRGGPAHLDASRSTADGGRGKQNPPPRANSESDRDRPAAVSGLMFRKDSDRNQSELWLDMCWSRDHSVKKRDLVINSCLNLIYSESVFIRMCIIAGKFCRRGTASNSR